MYKLFLLSSMLLGQNHWPEHRGDLQAVPLSGAGGYLGGDVCQPQETADTATDTLGISAQPAYEKAAGANQTGGSKMLCSGIGTRQLNTFQTGTGNDIYNFDYITTDRISSTVAFTANVTWVCGPSNAECAANFRDAFNAHAVATRGAEAYCDDATCTTLAVYIRFDSCQMCNFNHSITDVGGGGVFAIDVSGTNGKIFIPSNSINPNTSGLCFDKFPNTCIYSTNGNQVFVSLAGVPYGGISTTGFVHGNLTFSSTGKIQLSTGMVYVSTGAAPSTHSLGASDFGVTGDSEFDGLMYLDGIVANVGATCAAGDLRVDNGGGTIELCYCLSTNNWYCAPLAAGPTD